MQNLIVLLFQYVVCNKNIPANNVFLVLAKTCICNYNVPKLAHSNIFEFNVQKTPGKDIVSCR